MHMLQQQSLLKCFDGSFPSFFLELTWTVGEKCLETNSYTSSRPCRFRTAAFQESMSCASTLRDLSVSVRPVHRPAMLQASSGHKEHRPPAILVTSPGERQRPDMRKTILSTWALHCIAHEMALHCPFESIHMSFRFSRCTRDATHFAPQVLGMLRDPF